jgi:hypothetical protein
VYLELHRLDVSSNVEPENYHLASFKLESIGGASETALLTGADLIDEDIDWGQYFTDTGSGGRRATGRARTHFGRSHGDGAEVVPGESNGTKRECWKQAEG